MYFFHIAKCMVDKTSEIIGRFQEILVRECHRTYDYAWPNFYQWSSNIILIIRFLLSAVVRTQSVNQRFIEPFTIQELPNGLSCLYVQLPDGSMENHVLTVKSDAGAIRSVCGLCKYNDERLPCGKIRRSHYHCNRCKVWLCRPQAKDCFLKYHQMKFMSLINRGGK